MPWKPYHGIFLGFLVLSKTHPALEALFILPTFITLSSGDPLCSVRVFMVNRPSLFVIHQYFRRNLYISNGFFPCILLSHFLI